MKRAGYTLVELLVVTAIVAVLIGLLLAAVQKVRHRAALVQNQHSLRQIALACHGYEAAHGALPGTGHTLDAGGDPVVFFDILPHVEEPGVYGEFTVGPGPTVTAPTAPGAGPGRVVKAYVSPTDYTTSARPADAPGGTSYAVNRGVLPPGANLARSFPAGTGRTILFAERMMVCGGVPNYWYARGPKYLVFSAAPPRGNYAPPAETCDPDRCCAPSAQGIVVAMADGGVRLVTPAAATDNWVNACDPECTEPFNWTW